MDQLPRGDIGSTVAWSLVLAALAGCAAAPPSKPASPATPVTARAASPPATTPIVAATAAPRAARTVDVVDTAFGLRVLDPYRWMEGSDNPELVAWLRVRRAKRRTATQSGAQNWTESA